MSDAASMTTTSDAQLLGEVLQHALDGIAVVESRDGITKVAYGNATLAALLRRSEDWVAGRRLEDVEAEAPSDPNLTTTGLGSRVRLKRVDGTLLDCERWAVMPSVLLNNTTSEDWAVRPDSSDQWSHCAVGPLFVLYMEIAGIRPALPGFEKAEVRPQLGDLAGLELTAHTPRGPIVFRAEAQEEGHRVWVTLPADCPGELVLPVTEGKGVAVTDADVKAYYEQNKAQYTVAASRDVRHILLSKKNKDGSVRLVFSSKKPGGVPDANWIQTNPEKGFFAYFRWYSPTKA